VYSLAQIDAHLAQQPERWMGRTLRLWALAQPCPNWGSPLNPIHCSALQTVLVDPDDSALDPPLPLAAGSGDQLLGLLRTMPMLGRWLPVQRLAWEHPATYHVRLHATQAGSCRPPPCYEAELLDAAPTSP
jgi:hypothetical protein